MDLLLPWTLAYMIDTVIPGNRRKEILLWGLFMVVCSILAVVFNIIANRMASRVSSDAMFTIRGDLFEKVMYLSNHQIDYITRPSLISRLTSDTYNVHQMIGRIQRLGVRAPILFIGGIAMTMALDPVLACVLLATMPPLTAVVVIVSRKSIPMYAKLQDSVDNFVRLIREDIAGIRVIKALSKEDYERSRFDAVNQEVVDREKKATVTTAITNPAMNIFLNLGLVGVIIVGAYRVNAGHTEVGKILAFMTYFTIILTALMSISRMFIIISKAAASAERIDKVLKARDEMVLLEIEEEEQKEQSEESEQGEQGEESEQGEQGEESEQGELNEQSEQNEQGERSEHNYATPHIEFDHVSFSYNKVGDNLEDINFSLKRGETLGIIGATGSGKSTVVNLLMRFYDVGRGSIRIDGQDIRSIHLKELRGKFGTVFQNDVIFEDTIYENISMGRDITMQQAEEAAFYAKASDFIAEKGGLDHQLDIKGANLSGGQKQRILIARSLASHPEILVLDDSSSALDYKTDAALRKELKENFADTTCLIIAQRISSVMSADHIMVLDEGKIIGYGTHEELMETCEEYREIGSSQMGV